MLRALRPCVVLAVVVAAAGWPAAATFDVPPVVQVTEERGTYRVAAGFCVSQPAAAVLGVLSDYEAIPRFMPDVKSSRVVERGESRAVVEQEAVARLMMFSKRIHLVLEVAEATDSISFRDRSGASFTQYEGLWRVREETGGTAVTYDVTARPAFDVPEFLLKRLLRRDATRMIDRLRAEIAARAALAAPGVTD